MEPCDAKVCRICFSMDCELHLLHENMELYKGYEAVTGLMLADEEDLPPYLCTSCADQLMDCARFRHKSLQAHLMLLDILKKHDHISVESIQRVIQTLHCSDIEQDDERIRDNDNIDVEHEDKADGIATDFLDEIKAECMSDEDVVGDDVVHPCVEASVVKDEVIGEASVNDNDDSKLGTGDGLDGLTELEEKLNTGTGEGTEVKRDLNQTEGTEVNEKAIQKVTSSCELCGYENDSESQFLSHLRAHAEKTLHNGNKTESKRMIAVSSQYCCETCGKVFSTKRGVFNHVRLHLPKVYTCDVCNKSFQRKGTLANHMSMHFDKYKCGICKKGYRLKGDVKRHMRTHSGDKPYTCKTCQMSFLERSNLRRHMLLHTSEKKHACGVCKKTFHRSNYLKTHMLIHLGDRPYSCDVCQKSFRTKSALNDHSLTHSREKPYSCEVCKKTFNRKFNLQNHMLLHDDNKPFNCDICDSSFRRKRYLKVHMLKHSGEKPYSCDVCKKKLRSKSNLLSHMRVHASDEP